jgi:hypothetical protein
MNKPNLQEPPNPDCCPEQYCFVWCPPGGTVDLSGREYKTFEEAVAAAKTGTTLPDGGCGSIWPCRRSGVVDAPDRYEPMESILDRDGIPHMFFCTLEGLAEEFHDEFTAMNRKLWGSPEHPDE